MATTIAGEPVKLVRAHRITVSQSYYAAEQGSGYSWGPWGSNDRHYQGQDTEVTLAVPASAELAENNLGELMLYWRDGAYTAREALAAHIAVVQD